MDFSKIKEGVVVRPGDALILRLTENVSVQKTRDFIDELSKIVPPGVKVLVLNSGVEVTAIRSE